MKKFVFFTREQLSQLVEVVYSKKGETVKAKASFCEDSDCDIIILTKGDAVVHVPFSELMADLSGHLKLSFSHYDEMEVGNFGLGFVFFF